MLNTKGTNHEKKDVTHKRDPDLLNTEMIQWLNAESLNTIDVMPNDVSHLNDSVL